MSQPKANDYSVCCHGACQQGRVRCPAIDPCIFKDGEDPTPAQHRQFWGALAFTIAACFVMGAVLWLGGPK